MAANQERDFLGEAAGLLVEARSGTLATVSGGVPHAALVTPALGDGGEMLFLFSELAAHTKHLRVDPACALLVAGEAGAENPQTAPRILLSGRAEPVAGEGVRAAYLKAHPYANLYCDFGDFQFWRLIVNDAHYVGGFAAAARLDVAALQHEINRNRDDSSG